MEKTAKDKINEGKERFELLKLNSENFDIRTILELASNIRDRICNDKDVIDLCNVDEEYALLRKALLDDIKSFQMDFIAGNINQDENVPFSKNRVIDFDKAKAALSEMIDAELNLNLFVETEEPHIFGSIAECRTHLETLHRVSGNCKYGKYNVLIMGDFQSGKSTTLDALCDGRHICAIGKGIATSAVLVSVTYAEKESIIIHWREKEQFRTIFEKIRQYLQEFDWDNFNLDDNTSREQLANAIEELRLSKYCPKIGEGDAKFLMLCDFVLKYFDTSDLLAKKASLQSISDISEITKFPENGEETWKKSRLKDFSIDDVIFIFIESVECYIPSETLRDLNCTIIDSPGLFNSSYDTMVTEKAMIDAHAIMYVLPYYRGIGQDVCQSLYTIKDNYADLHRKLFIVNNLRLTDGRLTDGNAIYDSNCKKVKSMFDSIETITIHRYDARLSYLAQLKKLYVSDLSNEKDYHDLMRVTEVDFSGHKEETVFSNFNDAWAYYMGSESHRPIEDILKRCGFQNMITALKQFIAENESYAVVMSNGLIPMKSELISIKNSLNRSFVEPYNTSYNALVELWKSRIEKAEKFQINVEKTAKNELLDDKVASSLLKRMSDEEYLKLFTIDFYTNLSERISGVLYDKKKDLVVTKTLFKKNKTKFKERFLEKATPMIQEVIEELVKYKKERLHYIMESEQDITVINMFAPVMDKMEIKLVNDWNILFKDDKGFCMQDYIIIPKSLKSTRMVDSNQNTNKYNPDNPDKLGKGVDSTLIGGLVGQTASIVAGLAAMIAGYVTAILSIPDPTGATQFVLAAILGIGGTILAGLFPNFIRDECIKILSKKILPQIRSDAANRFRSIVERELEDVFKRYVADLKVNIQKMNNERDLALRPKANQEALCFRAVEAIKQIDKQVKTYDDYKRTFVKDETI